MKESPTTSPSTPTQHSLMIITSLVTLVLTIRTIVSGARTHHIHHGVENAADTWDDVWVVHLTRTTLPHVCIM